MQSSARSDFAEFYRSVYGELAGYGWSLTRDPHVGDELAQEALTRAYASWVRIWGDPRPYTFRIVTNLARDRWKRESRERATWESLESPGSGVDSDGGTLDAVRRLPSPQREVLLLHYYADLPVDEVAKVLRRPAGTVKRWLSEARAALAVALQETLGTTSPSFRPGPRSCARCRRADSTPPSPADAGCCGAAARRRSPRPPSSSRP